MAALLRGGPRVSVAILISGSIFREPVQRTSQSGRKYVVTTLKAASADNSSSDFWSVLAFGTTAGAELMLLAVGERLAVQGTLKIETYTKDGETKISRTLFADHVMALRQPPKERKAKAPPAGSKAADAVVKQSILPDATPETAAGGPAFFNDDIPFAMEWRA
jgi:single-stranded DNA-binding protein